MEVNFPFVLDKILQLQWETGDAWLFLSLNTKNLQVIQWKTGY